MKKPILFISKDGFAIIVNGQPILTIYRLPLENETPTDLIKQNYQRGKEEKNALLSNSSAFADAQEKFNFLTNS